jgi:hypothetical protein
MNSHERTEAHYLKVAQKLKSGAEAKASSTEGTPQATKRAALSFNRSKIERIPMIEIRQIVDDIRHAERDAFERCQQAANRSQ